MRRPLTRAEVADRVQDLAAGSEAAGRAQYEIARAEGEAIVKDPESKCSSARSLVGLYAALHAGTYGSDPEELRGPLFFAALAAAKKFATEEFSGQYDSVVGFVAWAFRRDRERGAARRLTWRHLFAAPRYLYSDWLARTSRARRAS